MGIRTLLGGAPVGINEGDYLEGPTVKLYIIEIVADIVRYEIISEDSPKDRIMDFINYDRLLDFIQEVIGGGSSVYTRYVSIKEQKEPEWE
jgi:hypothetical protein